MERLLPSTRCKLSECQYIINVVLFIIQFVLTLSIYVFNQNICKMSGWKLGTEKYMTLQDDITGIWRALQSNADEDADGIVTKEEWVSHICSYTSNTKNSGKT